MKKLRGIGIGKIVYLPGNHDYHTLQALNTSERVIKPLQKGQLLDPELCIGALFPLPLSSYIHSMGAQGPFSPRKGVLIQFDVLATRVLEVGGNSV